MDGMVMTEEESIWRKMCPRTTLPPQILNIHWHGIENGPPQ